MSGSRMFQNPLIVEQYILLTFLQYLISIIAVYNIKYFVVANSEFRSFIVCKKGVVKGIGKLFYPYILETVLFFAPNIRVKNIIMCTTQE